jgi:hypothetical protein
MREAIHLSQALKYILLSVSLNRVPGMPSFFLEHPVSGARVDMCDVRARGTSILHPNVNLCVYF